MAEDLDIAKVRELIELVAKQVDGVKLHDETVGLVLIVLHSHYLLRDFPGTPAEYHARVQHAYATALRMVTDQSGEAGSSGSIPDP